MISYIQGTIRGKSQTYLIIENTGLGYKVFTIPEILLKSDGSQIQLFTYHKISEDDESLYGFPTLAMLEFFELLLTVNGVGPKMALNMLAHANPEVLSGAIAAGDSTFFTQMSGVGKKISERIIIELKNKVAGGLTGPIPHNSSYDALVALGYSATEARGAIAHIDTSLSEHEQIKQALKFLSKK